MPVTLFRPETEDRPALIPDGTYAAKFIKIVEVENKTPPNPQFPDAKHWPSKYEWHFEITEPNESSDEDGEPLPDGNWYGLLMKGKTNPTVANEKAKGYGWLQAIIKRALFKGESLDDTAFTGFPCMLEIATFKDKDDSEWNYIKGVSRSKRGKMLPLPDWVAEGNAKGEVIEKRATVAALTNKASEPAEIEDLEF